MPKYWLWKTLLVTLPPSGRGVTESLALDQAPLTRMSGSGDRMLCGSVFWPEANDEDNDNDKNDMDPTTTANHPKNREYIFLLGARARISTSTGCTGRSVAHYILASL